MAVQPPSPLPALPRWVTALVLIAGAAAFLPTLGGGFLGDDFVYIARFREMPWSHWPHLFTHEWSEGIWGIQLRELRPFAALSFMSDGRMFGGDALGYRLTNLFLHLLATLLVVRLAWLYANGRVAAAAVAGLIFALHPTHAEAVSWITGRVDLIATVAALLFWLAGEIFSAKGHPARLALALLALFLGLFSKELCLFAPLLLLLRWVLLDLRAGGEAWRRRGALLLGAVAIITIYGYCRHQAFGSENVASNVWGNDGAWQRQASYLGWLAPILPFLGQAEWKTVPALGTLHAIWLTLAGLTIVGLGIALWRQARVAAHAVFFVGVWYFVTVAPMTAVGYFSPRHLYFPTVGLALGVGLLCSGTRLRALLGAALVAWVASAHLVAVRPWATNGTISKAAIAALDREMAAAPAGTIAVTAVPEVHRGSWLWSWASPHALRAPFVTHPPAAVVERVGNYLRPDSWAAEHTPRETVLAAPEAVALFVDDEGKVFSRRVPRAELQRRGETLPVAAGAISVEAWTEWVKAAAQP